MKVVGYVRVSTEEQALHGVSLDAQEDRIRAYAVAAGLEMVAVIREEGVSAGKPLASRPGGQALLALTAGKKVQHVVALKLDRLFRDAADCLNQTRAWDKAGIALHFVDMGGQALNTGSAMGRMFLTMTAAFAELERNLIAERTKTALQHKKAQGCAYSGVTPFGFEAIAGLLNPEPDEQNTLGIIRTMHETGASLRAIAGRLNDIGVSTRRGGAWKHSTVQGILAQDYAAIGAAAH